MHPLVCRQELSDCSVQGRLFFCVFFWTYCVTDIFCDSGSEADSLGKPGSGLCGRSLLLIRSVLWQASPLSVSQKAPVNERAQMGSCFLFAGLFACEEAP